MGGYRSDAGCMTKEKYGGIGDTKSNEARG